MLNVTPGVVSVHVKTTERWPTFPRNNKHANVRSKLKPSFFIPVLVLRTEDHFCTDYQCKMEKLKHSGFVAIVPKLIVKLVPAVTAVISGNTVLTVVLHVTPNRVPVVVSDR